MVTSEALSGGILGGYTLLNTFDSLLRRINATAKAATTNIFSYTYTYDTASRLSSVGSGTRSANYTYLANSPLVEQTTFKDGATVRMVTTRKYDSLNRLTSIGSGTSASATPHTAYNYAYNAANQRIQTTQHDTSYWVYEYDALGQVVSGKRFWADGTLVAGQQFEYRFDDIGNRTQTQTGGDSSGLNLRAASYTANGLNQYTSRDVPRYIEVQGIAEKASTVSVNGSATGVTRKDEYFRKELDLTGANTAVWQSLTIAASGGSPSSTGNRFLAPQPESFTYDDDGNTLTDGRWTYVWDAENRLISLTSLSNAPTGSKYQLNFVYDAQGRRIQKTVSTHNGTSYVPVSTNRFLYDGWNVTVQLEGSTGFGLRLYLWGLDLSGGQQGAGGVGGLVAQGPATGLNGFVAYDGNGNVTGLASALDGSISARYEYGPFGEVQRASGPDWQKNPFRFSTKWSDDESELMSYGYRYYDSSKGRWPNRDPLGDEAFAVQRGFRSRQALSSQPTELRSATAASRNRRGTHDYGYAFVSNDPVFWIDPDGLVQWSPAVDTGQDINPWDDAVFGDVMVVKTDAGTPIPAWKPHDGKTYWCHGYTFDGHSAAGGPLSIWGNSVLTVLKDEGWLHVCCGMAGGGIAVFGESGGVVHHSGKISSVVYAGPKFDEGASQLTSKWGQQPLNTSSFARNAGTYGKYKCYVKKSNQRVGCCPKPGDNEIAP